MAMKDNDRDYNDQKKSHSRGKRHTEGNQEKHNKRKRSNPSIKKEGRFNLRRRQNRLHG